MGAPKGGMPGMPPGPAGRAAPMAMRCAICCSSCALRTSLRCARATYSGLPLSILPFISVTARVASSGEDMHTKPKPLDLPFSSFMTLAEVMVPAAVNSSRSLSSSTSSARFLTYRFMPWYLAMRSWRTSSNLALSTAERSAFFCARPAYRVLPLCSLPCSVSTALAAASGSLKLTKPKPLELPLSSFMMTHDVMSPNSVTILVSSSSVTSGARFLMYTLVYSSLPWGRSVRLRKGPTYTILSSIIMPFTLAMASSAASWVSKCTKP
mmetsp:Transcript_32936/g.83598  ORF Transcript_32936/g.83598 Transcript_32936/m.83598 type:complete len:267 (+) Transcript_32936:1962-2762(+)